jgi:hypothetical protein
MQRPLRTEPTRASGVLRVSPGRCIFSPETLVPNEGGRHRIGAFRITYFYVKQAHGHSRRLCGIDLARLLFVVLS